MSHGLVEPKSEFKGVAPVSVVADEPACDVTFAGSFPNDSKPINEVGYFQSQCSGNFHHRIQGDVQISPFNLPDEVVMEVRLLGQLLLGQACRPSTFPYFFSDKPSMWRFRWHRLSPQQDGHVRTTHYTVFLVANRWTTSVFFSRNRHYWTEKSEVIPIDYVEQTTLPCCKCPVDLTADFQRDCLCWVVDYAWICEKQDSTSSLFVCPETRAAAVAFQSIP